MTTDTVGGVWEYSLQLGQGLAERGVEIFLAAMGPLPSRSQREAVSRIPGIRLFESGFKLEWMDDPWQEVELAGEWLLRLARMADPDLIHLNGYVHGSLDWRRPVLMVAHSCVCSWWEAVHGEAAPATYSRYRREVAKGMASASVLVAPTRAMLENARKFHHCSGSFRVIHNACSTGSFRPGKKRNTILSAGRIWDEGKNIMALASIAPELPWPVQVAGDTASSHGGRVVLDNVQHLGRLDRSAMAAAMGEAGIYAHPARYEPFGLTVLEAAMSGCALLLGDIASLRELWEGAALFVDPRDEASLSDQLKRLCLNDRWREDLALKARERSRGFSPERMTVEYLEAYSRCGS